MNSIDVARRRLSSLSLPTAAALLVVGQALDRPGSIIRSYEALDGCPRTPDRCRALPAALRGEPARDLRAWGARRVVRSDRDARAGAGRGACHRRGDDRRTCVLLRCAREHVRCLRPGGCGLGAWPRALLRNRFSSPRQSRLGVVVATVAIAVALWRSPRLPARLPVLVRRRDGARRCRFRRGSCRSRSSCPSPPLSSFSPCTSGARPVSPTAERP